ncbi:MAG: ABC transporter substrate-binding protein [Candidatus Sumerlaeaceae bacterium]|nr:ABC transporter substrate-binding protein [Candidatus Sumerlaeaceae bacterium]
MRISGRRWNAIVFIAALCVLIFESACGRRRQAGAPKTAGAASSQVLTVLLGSEPLNMDPALISDPESAAVAAQVYEGLVTLEPGTVRVAPALAQRWETSADGLRLTFQLKEGVFFHDGTPCDADAVKFSLLRQCDPNHPYHLGGRMRFAKLLFGDPASTETELVRDVSAPDSRTVVIELARPFSPFLRNLATVQASVVSPSAVQTLGDDFNTTMVGTGPFRLMPSRAGATVLARNEAYHGPAAPLKELRFKVSRDAAARAAALAKGDADLAAGLDGRARAMLADAKNICMSDDPAMNVSYLALNCARTPLDNRLVRQAVAAALDATVLVESAMDRAFVPAAGLLPPGMTGHDPARRPAVGNLERARRLLEEAGYPNGFTVTLAIQTRPRIFCTNPAKLAAKIREDLGRAGISVRIEEKDMNAFADSLKRRDYQMALTGWVADTGDPDNFLHPMVRQPDNDQNYSSDGVAQLMAAAAAEPDEVARAELYRKVEALVLADAPVIPISHARHPFGVHARVKGFKFPPLLVPRLAGVSAE